MQSDDDERLASLIDEAQQVHRRDGTAGLDRLCARHPDVASILLANVRGRQFMRGVRDDLTATRAPAVGEELADRFEIRGELGRGGMGHVLRAFDRRLDREVALKIVATAGATSEAARERILAEGRALAKLRHPGIVRVHDVGVTAGGLPFLVMDLIEGVSLAERLRRIRSKEAPPLAVDAIVRLVIQVAEAIDAAHANGVIHRDVKPSNVLVDGDDLAYVIDFGIARATDAAITRTGAPAGTLQYVAPELLRTDQRARVDRTVDVYSLGVTLYEALTLRCPFEAESSGRLLNQILSDEPPPPRAIRPELSLDLETICLHAIEKRPQDRYATAAEFAADLRDLLALRPIRARPSGPITRALKLCRRRPWQAAALAAAALALVAVAAFAVFFRRQARQREFERVLVEAYAEAGRYADQLDLARLRSLIDRAAAFDAQNSDVRELTAAWHQKDRGVRSARPKADAKAAGERMRAALAGGKSALAEVRSAYDDFERGLEEFALLEPGDHNITLDAAELHELGAEWDRRRSAAEVAKAGLRSGVLVAGSPVGAEAFLFRECDLADLEPGAKHRLVPAPLHASATAPVKPGTACLEVIAIAPGSSASRAGLAVGDLIVAGAKLDELRASLRRSTPIPVTTFRDGVLREVTIAGGEEFGATLAPTAAPLLIGPESSAGALPLRIEELSPGEYVLAVRAPGFEMQRVPFRVEAGAPSEVDVALLPTGTTPPGFVFVPAGRYLAGSRDTTPAFAPEERFIDGFWIGRAEVTVREYLRFLDDLMRRPEEREQLEATERSRLYWRIPRRINVDHAERPICAIAEGWSKRNGLYHTSWDPDLAIHSISGLDADAYCEWLTARARARGEPWIFRLPTEDEWEKAARGVAGRSLPWGESFDPTFCKCLFARRADESTATLALEPVMAVAIDESPFGVHDTAGGCLEWCVGGSTRKDISFFRPWRGGTANSPGDNDGASHRCALRNEGFPDRPSGDDGFRVVARRVRFESADK